MKAGWIITKDFGAESLARVLEQPVAEVTAEGTMGPSTTTLTPEEAKALGTRFRMKDDDGEVYYEGYVVENPDDPESILAPLDNYGMPAAGCTTLETWKPGKGGGWKPVN